MTEELIALWRAFITGVGMTLGYKLVVYFWH